MFVDQLATAADVTQLLGDVDAQTISRILAIAPTRDELARAIHDVDDDDDLDDESGTPSAARVASIRRVIAPPTSRDRSDAAPMVAPW